MQIYRYLKNWRPILAGTLLVGALGGCLTWLIVAFGLPTYHERAARQALARFAAAEARLHLQSCLAAWPESSEVHLLAARAARLSDDLDEAEEHLRACDHLGRSEASTLESALLRAQNGYLEEVEPFLRKQLEDESPDAPFILDALTRGYVRVYHFNLAQLCIKRWLDLDPNNMRALLHRARIWERVHAHQDAADDYRRVLEQDNGSLEARLGLANCLLELSLPAEALEHLEQLRQREPNDARILVRLACCQNALNRPAEAEATLDRVLAADPDCTPALQGRAQVALQQGNAELALTWARRAMAVDPYDYQANYLFYQCLKQCDKEQEAAEQFTKVERIKARILRMQELGIRKLQANPHDPALRCEMGQLSVEMGQEEVGLGWFLSALKKAPDYKPAHAALAAYYERHGDAQRAAYHRQQAARVLN